jgi:hypothetical protein
LQRIALRLEHWLRKKESRWPAQQRGEQFPLFVRLVLVDWLYDKCVSCHGRGMLGVERTTLKSVRLRCPQCAGRGYTRHVTPRGHLLETICRRCCGNRTIAVWREVEREKPRTCPACNGLRIALLTPAMWAALLGIAPDEWLRHWEKRMLRLRNLLMQVDQRTALHLAQQLAR